MPKRPGGNRHFFSLAQEVWLPVLLAALLLLPGCSIVTDDGPAEQPTSSSSPAEAAERVLRSTVEVRAYFGDGRGGLGTGVLMTDDGLYVTNDHVLLAGGDELARRIVVTTPGGRTADATVVHRAPDVDLAFLRAGLGEMVPAEFRDDLGELERGAQVLAVGAPRHFEDFVLRGTVRRVLQNVQIQERPGLRTLIVTNVPLEQGFSGGPLADDHGRVVGINVAGVQMTGMEGVRALTIPAATVLAAAEAAALRQ